MLNFDGKYNHNQGEPTSHRPCYKGQTLALNNIAEFTFKISFNNGYGTQQAIENRKHSLTFGTRTLVSSSPSSFESEEIFLLLEFLLEFLLVASSVCVLEPGIGPKTPKDATIVTRLAISVRVKA